MPQFKFRLASLFGILGRAVRRLAKSALRSVEIVLVGACAVVVHAVALEALRINSPAFLEWVVVSLASQPMAIPVTFGTLIGLELLRKIL